MLQWMGGSRRKVTASRKSTQKRQKQYFEQRKRQQQQQQSAGLESYADGTNIRSEHKKEHRSLDLLSLLNLSTIAQACKSSCSSGTPAGCQEETVSPKKLAFLLPHRVLFSATDSHGNVFYGDGDKADHWKTTEHQLSVFDLLGEDGQNGNSEGNPVQEAHVAFSIKGLGKVGTVTPVHSPQQPRRIPSYGCSAPLKAARQIHSSKNLHYVPDDLDLEVDAMMQDINMPHSGSSMWLPYSRGVMDPFSYPNQKLNASEDCMQLYGHSCKIQNSFSDGKIFHDIEDEKENIWKDRSSFPDDNFLDERECNTSWKNWPCQMEGNSVDFFEFGNNEMLNFDVDCPHLLKKRVTKTATDRFKILEPCTPCYKHQASENNHEFISSDWPRYVTVGRNFDFRDVADQPNRSVVVTEDARDCLSLLSEESCSSSAVRGKATQNSSSNSMARHRMSKHGNDFSSPEFGVKNIYPKEARCRNRDEIQQGENENGSGKFSRMSNPSRSKAAHYSNSTFQKKLGPHDSWLFEERYPSAQIDLGFSSFCQTLETKCASSGCKPWAEDPFSAFPVPKLPINYKQRSKHDDTFCQPFNRMDSYDSPILSNVGFGPTKQDLFSDSEMEGIYPGSSHVGGSHGHIEFSDLSVQESVSRGGEKESKIKPTDCQTFELEKESCIGGLSSENEKAVDASDSMDNSSEFKETKDETPEPLESMKMMCSPEHAEISSVKIPDKCDCSVYEKEHHHDAQIPLLCQNGRKEIQDVGPEERKIASEEQNNCANPSHQVMMLESYVLQLLCVQKVLKDASALEDAMEKV